MDFFEHQDQARRTSGWLVALFVVAVIGILLSINVLGLILYNGVLRPVPSERDISFGERGLQMRETQLQPVGTFDVTNPDWYSLPVMGIASLLGVAVMGERTLNKTLQLRGGGEAVASMLGGRPLADDPQDAKGQQLRNVVDEMAIAAGLPAPGVWVMEDEPGINAFAAGRTPGDAVIGVTRGCLEKLDRDELQGVIAHEFAHILHGDMRLNVKLIGALAGILGIGMIGMVVLRSLAFTGGSSYSRSRKGDDGRAALVILLFGVALTAIGYIGALCGRLIQSGISRQREYLADAAAAQFTRNPEGLANALKKIAGFSLGGTVQNHHAGETAHLFFAEGFDSPLLHFAGNWFGTHPPIEERIKRLDPSFDGRLPKRPARHDPETNFPGTRNAVARLDAAAGSHRTQMAAPALAGSVGQLAPEGVAWAGQFLGDLPAEISNAVHDPYAARAVVLALLLDDSPDAAARRGQLELIARFETDLAHLTDRLLPAVSRTGPEARLPIAELTLPALARLSAVQAANLCRMLREVIESDRRLTIAEFALYNVIRRHLAECEDERPAAATVHAVRPLLDPIRVLLSGVAAVAGDEERRAIAYVSGINRLKLNAEAADMADVHQPITNIGVPRVAKALDQIDQASLGVKRRVLDAAAHAAASDGVLNVRELDLLRGIAASLGLPLPPVVQPA
jgi:Zn-dependent protease with chaperone function